VNNLDNLDKLSRNALLDILTYQYGYIREYTEKLETDELYFLIDRLDKLEMEREDYDK
jgi:hypothetical protein